MKGITSQKLLPAPVRIDRYPPPKQHLKLFCSNLDMDRFSLNKFPALRHFLQLLHNKGILVALQGMFSWH